MKSLICIGASALQLPVLKAAKNVGLYLVITDRNPSAIAKQYADEIHVASATDIEKIMAIAKQVSSESDLVGIYSGSDFGLMTVAVVGAALDLPACYRDAVSVALDKHKAIDILSAAELNVPKGVVLKSKDEWNEQLSYPLVVKPVDSSGSRGVAVVPSKDEMSDAIDNAFRYSDNDVVLIEQQLKGEHIDVSGFFANDVFYPAGILDRFFSAEPDCYPVYGIQPPRNHEPVWLKKIYATLEQAARALGINVGPVKGDFIVVNNDIYILEVAPRFHGDVSTSHVTPRSYGVNPVQQWFEYLADEKLPNVDSHIYYDAEQYAGWMGIFPSKTGVIKSIVVDDSCKNSEQVEIYLHRQPGYRIDCLRDNTAVLGFIWAIGHDENELIKVMSNIRDAIKVEMQ